MITQIRLIFAAAAIGIAGCAAGPMRVHRPDSGSAVAKPLPREKIPLAEIEPQALPPGREVSEVPPLQAVHLYAQARSALLDHRRADAVALLEEAVAIDSDSYDLRLTLGRLYLQPHHDFDDQSIAMLEKAAEIEPDHFDLQFELGRQCAIKGDAPAAITHLRSALLTRQYSDHPGETAICELFLARTLRREGYDTAALQMYQRLSAHLKSSAGLGEKYPEMAPLLEHAGAIDAEVAELLARCGRDAEAILAYADLISREPGKFELRKGQVGLLLALHRKDEAMQAAQDAAVHFHADAPSIALLNEACISAAIPGGAMAALRRLHEAHPDDPAILYALADLLKNAKQGAEAERILEQAERRFPGDDEIVRRRFALALQRGDRDSAARLLLLAAAARPDTMTLQAPSWWELTRPSSNGRLKYSDLEKIDVPKQAEAVKWFWVSRLAMGDRRVDVAAMALHRAAAIDPPLEEAYRNLFDEIVVRDDLDESQQSAETEKLVERARAAGGEGLANEMRGMMLLHDGKPTLARPLLEKAARAGRSPDRYFFWAAAERQCKQDSAADSVLWKLISDWPGFREAYQDLYFSYVNRGLEAQAERVITVWIAANPTGMESRRLQAIQYARSGRGAAAIEILTRILDDHPADAETLSALQSLYARSQRTEVFTELMETRHTGDPGNFVVSSALVDALLADSRENAAADVADSARKAARDDVDVLCLVAGLYQRIGKKEKSEDCLAEVLKLEPGHPFALNDLGFAWADSGRNLEQSQDMIARALAADPHNASVLDSMAWVVYKRGHFQDALRYINQALRSADSNTKVHGDPALYDHRGDILYRIGDHDAAARNWKHAADAVAAMGENVTPEFKRCREAALEKARCVAAGETVPVAPIGEAPVKQSKK